MIGHGLDQRIALRLPLRALGVAPGRHRRRATILPVQHSAIDQVDPAMEATFTAQRHTQRPRARPQLVLQLLQHALERGADAVHLVDERNQRHAMPARLAPHGFRLRLHAVHGREHGHGTVEHAQRALDLDGEVDVAGGVDQGQLMQRQIARRPLCVHGSGADGDATLAFDRREVGGRIAIVHFTDAVDLAGLPQKAFGKRGFASVDVGNDAEVAKTRQSLGVGVHEMGSCCANFRGRTPRLATGCAAGVRSRRSGAWHVLLAMERVEGWKAETKRAPRRALCGWSSEGRDQRPRGAPGRHARSALARVRVKNFRSGIRFMRRILDL
ncbi:hypothetical protein D3C81_791500 [compost metagenome]